MIVGILIASALAAPAAPPAKAGSRVVSGLMVETNPTWGQSHSTAARFGAPYGRGPVPSPAAKPRAPELRYRGMTNKFSVNILNGVVSAPTRDLWVAAPMPVR